MKKKIIWLILIIISYCSVASAQNTNANVTLPGSYLPTPMSGYILNKTDTVNRKIVISYANGLNDAIVRWAELGPYVTSHAPSTTFTSNIVNNTSVQIGSVPVGGTLASAGKTPEQVITAIFTQTIHPTYNLPTASISGSPSPGNYEIGTSLSITLSSTFTQNQGGSNTTTVYKRGATTVTSPDVITLTSITSYTVQKGYNTGICIANNLGTIDCQVGAGNAPNPAPVAGGTATSGAITYNPLGKLYTGRAAGTTATSSEILAAAGGVNQLTNSHNGPWTVVASGTNHPFISYPASLGTITLFKDGNGSDITSLFVLTTASFTNAQGYSQSYNTYTFLNATAGNFTFVSN